MRSNQLYSHHWHPPTPSLTGPQHSAYQPATYATLPPQPASTPATPACPHHPPAQPQPTPCQALRTLLFTNKITFSSLSPGTAHKPKQIEQSHEPLWLAAALTLLLRTCYSVPASCVPYSSSINPKLRSSLISPAPPSLPLGLLLPSFKSALSLPFLGLHRP